MNKKNEIVRMYETMLSLPSTDELAAPNMNSLVGSDESEKAKILHIYRFIQDELAERIDRFSQDVIISQIELLLNYSNLWTV